MPDSIHQPQATDGDPSLAERNCGNDSSHTSNDVHSVELEIISSLEFHQSLQRQDQTISWLKMKIARLHKEKRKDRAIIFGLKTGGSSAEGHRHEIPSERRYTRACPQIHQMYGRELQKLHAELVQSNQKLQVLGKENESLKALAEELKPLRGLLQVSQQQLKACNDDLISYSKELQGCENNLALTEQRLLTCQDDLFRLQPFAQVTDSDISDSFVHLSQSIGNWVDGELFEFEAGCPRHDIGQMFCAGGNPEMVMFLEIYPKLGEYLIKHLIHRQLLDIVFGKQVYLFALSEVGTNMLQNIEHSMAKLEPRRGRKFSHRISGKVILKDSRIRNNQCMAFGITYSSRVLRSFYPAKEPQYSAHKRDDFQYCLNQFSNHQSPNGQFW